jgi:membrane fusion protein, multidrug efflux system
LNAIISSFLEPQVQTLGAERPALRKPVTCLALTLALVLAGCSKPAPAPEPVRAVRTLVVKPTVVGSGQEFAAEVRARTETRLSFRVPGRLTQRPTDVGQVVRAGQLLAQIDAADLRLGEDAARAGVSAALANVELGTAELKRYQDLRQQGFISALELERREAALTAQRAQLAQHQAQLAAQGNQASYATLSAPASGVVTAVEAEVGAVLAAGSPVLRLALDGPRDAVFAVPEDAVSAMRRLKGVKGAVRVTAWGRGEAFAATVREVAAAADPATRTFLVKAELAAADLQLGQTLTVRIEQAAREGVVRLPLAAVMHQQGLSTVWLLDPASMTVRVQPVVVGAADGDHLVVTQGLVAGQRVVTAGVHTLTPGQKVRLYSEGVKAVIVSNTRNPAPSMAASAASAPLSPAANR